MSSNSLTICSLLFAGCGGTVYCPHGAHIQHHFWHFSLNPSQPVPLRYFVQWFACKSIQSILTKSFSLVFSPHPGYSQHFHSPSCRLGLLVQCPYQWVQHQRTLRIDRSFKGRFILLDKDYRSPNRKDNKSFKTRFLCILWYHKSALQTIDCLDFQMNSQCLIYLNFFLVVFYFIVILH